MSSDSEVPEHSAFERVLSSLDRMHRDFGDIRQQLGTLTAKIDRHENCHLEVQQLKNEMGSRTRDLEDKILLRERTENTERNAAQKNLSDLKLEHSVEIAKTNTRVALMSALVGGGVVGIIELVKILAH